MSGLAFVAVGSNETRAFGLPAAERARRFAAKAKLVPGESLPEAGGVILADLDFAWDPAWLRHLELEPGLAVTLGGRAVLAHAADPGAAHAIAQAMAGGRPLPPGAASRVIAVETGASLYNHALRKRETLYVLPLTPGTRAEVEKASYDGAYKGVTDLLTLYLWRGAAFHLTRWAAAVGMTPNMVTSIGAGFCVIAFACFWQGYYWAGIGTGLVFMVLDTVDGKLARCTGTSSKWGNVFDHGIDQVHPPFWWWAWAHGLAFHAGLADPSRWTALWVILVGYVVQRLTEGAFMRLFGGMHIHTWRRVDSRFRLITARRNPNMVILFASLLLGQPDWGLAAVAWWTAISCVFHLVRLGQAMMVRSQGRPVTSWLSEAA